MGWDSRSGGAGRTAGKRRAGSTAEFVSAGCIQPRGAGRYAVLLLQCKRRFDGDHHHAGSAAGAVCGGAGRCGGRSAGRAVGIDSRARELAKEDLPWSAWYCYEAARSLLVPVDFLSSPNLEKLGGEQAQIKNSPLDAFPYSLPDGSRTWKIDAVRLDTTLRQADLGVTYESTGVTDPAALRTEAVAVLSALLKAQPGLRENFHGLWAYAVKDGKPTPVIELPMTQIP